MYIFVSRINKKCDKYISWLRDPGSLAVDAFTIRWSDFFFYCFPPFSVILRVFQKIIEDKATGIVVVPLWPSQPWYPVFMSMIKGSPIILKPSKNLLSFNSVPHPLWKRLFLVAGILSSEH